MMEVVAGSNRWFQAQVLDESALELEVLFPGALAPSGQAVCSLREALVLEEARRKAAVVRTRGACSAAASSHVECGSVGFQGVMLGACSRLLSWTASRLPFPPVREGRVSRSSAGVSTGSLAWIPVCVCYDRRVASLRVVCRLGWFMQHVERVLTGLASMQTGASAVSCDKGHRKDIRPAYQRVGVCSSGVVVCGASKPQS